MEIFLLDLNCLKNELCKKCVITELFFFIKMYFFSKWFKILNSNFIFLIFKAKGANLNFARCTIQRCDVTCRQVAVSQGSINHVTGQARPTSQPQDLLVPCNPQRENASIRASNPCQVSTGRKREGGGGIWDNLPLLTPLTLAVSRIWKQLFVFVSGI